MWFLWTALLVCCAPVPARAASAGAAAAPAQSTTRAPARTLDRQAAELAWRNWLQSPESGNPNAPPRRITTKSLFITPLVCPKGQRLDSNGCVQVVTLNKDEHERILLEQLNALFTSAPSGDVVYDYGDEDPGPLQLTLPIAVEPQAERLQAHEPLAQAQQQQPTYTKPDKKDEDILDAAAGLAAELELLQLQHGHTLHNKTPSVDPADLINHNVLQDLDKPKRASQTTNSTESEGQSNESDEGQKEIIFGHVNIDPILFSAEADTTTTENYSETQPTTTETQTTEAAPVNNDSVGLNNNKSDTNTGNPATSTIETNSTHALKKDGDKSKLNPENDYGDIGEAIKLISRYAEVTTDDNFKKDENKFAIKDDSVLGTRTKLQYRRNKPKPAALSQELLPPLKKDVYYRYPWQSQHSPTPPPDYPFRHIQDYWPGRNQFGGVYNQPHENPKRHHHMFPHNYYRSHNLPFANYPGPYPGLEGYPGRYARRVPPHRVRAARSHGTNRDLYTLLGLRHWFSSEGTSKR